MVIDTSAIIAVLLDEANAADIARAIDCFAYALAKSRRLPLLFQGADFSHTDILGVPLSAA